MIARRRECGMDCPFSDAGQDASGMMPVVCGTGVPIERIDVSAYKVPTDCPESDGTYPWEATTMVLVEVQAGGKIGLGYSYADTATAGLVRDLLGGVVQGPGCDGRGRVLVGDGRGRSQPRSAGHRGDGDLGRRRGALGSEGPSARSPAGDAARGREGRRAGLRQRRFHIVFDERTPRTARRLGRRGHPARQDEDRPRSGSRTSTVFAPARECIGPEAELFVDANGAYSRKQALAQAKRFAELGVTLVRGAGLVRRPRGPAVAARSGSGRHGHRRRRIWLRSVLFPADARGRRRRRAAGRCDPLRRHHRLPAGRRTLCKRIACRCRPTARPRCTCTRLARCRISATWNISTTTSASSIFSSTAP